MVDSDCRARCRFILPQPLDDASGEGDGDKARSRAADDAESCVKTPLRSISTTRRFGLDVGEQEW